MATSFQTSRNTSTTVSLSASTTPRIVNKSTLASTETSEALTDGTKQILIRARGNSNLQLSFTATESSTKFLTVPKGASYTITDLSLSSKTLYFQTDQADTVEIMEWS